MQPWEESSDESRISQKKGTNVHTTAGREERWIQDFLEEGAIA